jgi:hypothetical protein
VTSSTTQNGQIPTDPTTVLLLALVVTGAASQLTTDQAQAVIATGGIAEFALLLLRLARGGR